MPSINSNFDWVDTPKPTERAFAITAKEGVSDVIPDFLNTTVLWSTCPKWIKSAETIPLSLQGYRLIHAAKSGYQKRTFYFGYVRTALERKTAFKTRWVKRMHSWPTVLLKLWFEEGRLPLSGVDSDGNISSAKRVHQRAKFRPGNMYPTWFKIRHFLSETPFPRKGSQSVPMTDSIQWSFDGNSGSFPECQHPGARFPAYQTSGNVIFGAGTPSVEIGSDLVAQEFPPTPMPDWGKYVVEDTRNEVMGTMEHRILVEAYPPIDDRESKS